MILGRGQRSALADSRVVRGKENGLFERRSKADARERET
jgi:hypothetical protein